MWFPFVQVPPTPITVAVEPIISRDEAIALARERYGKPITASEVGLHIFWSSTDDGSQVLYWSVGLTGIEPWEPGGTHFKGAGYSIDAHTGQILSEHLSQDFSEAQAEAPEEEWS